MSMKTTKKKKYWSRFGSHKKWIKLLKKYVHFCNKCEEYITADTGCSNPFCPEKIEEEK